jgi:hypothetical protein
MKEAAGGKLDVQRAPAGHFLLLPGTLLLPEMLLLYMPLLL